MDDEQKIWLVALMHEPAEGGSAMSSHRLFSTWERAGEGLRSMFDKVLGIDDLPPEVVTHTEVFDEIEGYEGSCQIEDKRISWLVVPLAG